jgi:general stress protein YciG
MEREDKVAGGEPIEAEATEDKKGELTVREAGRKGGQKGGQTTKARYGPEFYRDIGRKGGEAVRDARGHEFYEEIGKKGGQKVRQLIEQGKKAGR